MEQGVVVSLHQIMEDFLVGDVWGLNNHTSKDGLFGGLDHMREVTFPAMEFRIASSYNNKC
jgi:hypothetical protein